MHNQKRKYIILVFCDAYLPGYKAGGPVRTIANMVEYLEDEFQFKIITLNHDLNEADKPYQNIKSGHWNRIGKADVFYLSSQKRLLGEFINILNSINYDIVYLNSFFSPDFTIRPLLLRRFGLIPDKPFALAPRGEFSPGALNLKKIKKKVYFHAAKLFGLYRGILWQASSLYEEANIRQFFGENISVVIAPNLPPLLKTEEKLHIKSCKGEKSLNILFLSRITRMKNLKGALVSLKDLKGDIQFDVYGPIEDKAYWDECLEIFRYFPNNIKVRHYSGVQHDKVMSIMANYDIFFLPTLGENFGHVILEALCAGCPVLISDRTPWRNLEKKKVGWDLPLEQPERFKAVLQDCVNMSNEDYIKWSRNAREYGIQITKDGNAVSQNRALFQQAINFAGFIESGKG